MKVSLLLVIFLITFVLTQVNPTYIQTVVKKDTGRQPRSDQQRGDRQRTSAAKSSPQARTQTLLLQELETAR